MVLDQRQIKEALIGILSDDERYISSFFKIADKNRTRVPFVPKPAQIRALRAMKTYNRNLWLKGSQMGITSIVSAKNLKDTMTTPDTTCVTVAHEEFLTTRLLQRTQMMYDSIPERFRVEMDHNSSSEKRFPTINSVMYIGTARSKVFGRGEPIHIAHFSEAAFYPPNAKENIILPTLQRVPLETGKVVFETTPNGEDEFVYPEIQKFLAGESVYHVELFYWWEEPDNILPDITAFLDRLEIPDNWRGQFKLTDEEEMLQREHGLTHDQIRWRRLRIKESGAMFWQEHLESLSSCFLLPGQAYYDTQRLLELSKQCFDAPYQYKQALVWKKPEDNGIYFIGTDPGQGRNTQSATTVWQAWPDKPEVEEVARLATFDEPHIYAPKIMDLAYYYKTGLIIPESNAHGLGFIAGIAKYPRVYRRRDPIQPGKITPQARFGWETTARTKPFMMREVQRRLPHMITHDAEYIRQCRAIIDLGNGHTATTTLDDIHDSAGLAFMGMIGAAMGGVRGYKGRSGWNW